MSVQNPLPHDAARLHVTGAARYVDDIPTPGNTLHLAFGLSTIAAGQITEIDLDAVRAAPDKRLDIVVMDDASEDGTPDVVLEHVRRDPRVRLTAAPKLPPSETPATPICGRGPVPKANI